MKFDELLRLIYSKDMINVMVRGTPKERDEAVETAQELIAYALGVLPAKGDGR